MKLKMNNIGILRLLITLVYFHCFQSSASSSINMDDEDISSTSVLEKRQSPEEEKTNPEVSSNLANLSVTPSLKQAIQSEDKAQDNSTVPQPSKKKRKKKKKSYIEEPIAASSSTSDFKGYNQQLYEDFIYTVLKFNALNTLSKDEKVQNLSRWSELAGVPIVGLTKDENFFRRNLHIFPSNHEVLKSLDNYNIGVACYTPQDVYLDYTHKSTPETKKSERKTVTESIRKSVLIYHPSQDLRYFPNNEEKQNAIRKNNKKAYVKLSEEEKISPKICDDFLEGYTRPLIDFDEFYLDEVIKGIHSLPKSVVDFMRGRAIYLTTEIGRSMFIHTASNFPKIEYLGLIPGVFLERQGKDNHIIHSRLIHEIGHLIHQTVITVRHYDSKLSLHSVALEPSFPQLHQFSSQLGRVLNLI